MSFRRLVGLLVGLVPCVLAQGSAWSQCGGIGWTGDTTCVSGYTCTYQNEYYSQCTPSATTGVSTTSSSSTTSKASSTSTTSTTSGTSSTTSAAASSTITPSRLVGQTPALGWNSWNTYGGDITEDKVIAAANAMVSLGLKDAGYEYVNVDDTWAQMTRDSSTQRMLPNYSKFPDGINGTAAAVHALGMKFGIYSDAGTATCAGYPGSLYYEDIDAQTWDDWGVDYIKYDNCNVPSNWTDTTAYDGDWSTSNSAVRYRRMTEALSTISRPVLYSICNWGNALVWTWGATVGHSWRMASDSSPSWSYITSILSQNVQYLDYIDFYAHNDMDMMEIGNGGLTIEEERTHFAAWAFLKSPILLGTNLSNLSSDEVAIITNAELLAFSQDTTVGAAAKPFTPYTSAPTTSPPEYYSGESSSGTHVFIINTSSSSATKTFDFANVPGLGAGTYTVHDMWAGEDVATATDSYEATVAAHDTAAFLLNPA